MKNAAAFFRITILDLNHYDLMNRWGHRRGFVMKNNHMTICNRVGCAQQHVMITAGHSEQRLPLLVATVTHLRVEGLAVDVVEVSRAHLLRQRDGVHVGVAEHSEEGARQGEAPGRRRVAAAIEHAAGPLGLDHDVPSGGGVHL